MTSVPPSRNNGGGHVNHSMFWQIMKPKGGGDPTGPIADAIKKAFAYFKSFQEKFNAAGVAQFGSGWAWLVGDSKGEVKNHLNAQPGQTRSPKASFQSSANDVWEARLLPQIQQPPPRIPASLWGVVNWTKSTNATNPARSNQCASNTTALAASPLRLRKRSRKKSFRGL